MSVFQGDDATRPILFLHFHKAGGTAMCNSARESRLRLPPGHRSCNDKANGDGFYGAKVPEWGHSCASRARYMQQRAIAFTGVESFLAHEPCTKLTYLTSMRPPVERALSQLEHNFYRFDKVLRMPLLYVLILRLILLLLYY